VQLKCDYCVYCKVFRIVQNPHLIHPTTGVALINKMFIIKKAVSWSIIRPRYNSLFVRTNVIEVYSRVNEDLVFHLWLTFQKVQSRLVQYYFIRKFRWGICWFAKWIVDTQFCYPPVYELWFTKKNNIVVLLVCKDNNVFIMDARRAFCNILRLWR
jgi:hypothetical protein